MQDGGRDCPDGQWRYVITIEDAVRNGFNLASIEKLRNRYNKDTFNMLYMCVFVDSGASVFKYNDLENVPSILVFGMITILMPHGHLGIKGLGRLRPHVRGYVHLCDSRTAFGRR